MADETREEPGRVVARLLEEKGWTAYRLGAQAGVNDALVRAMAAGSDPRLSTALAVFRALGAEGRAAWLAMLDESG